MAVAPVPLLAREHSLGQQRELEEEHVPAPAELAPLRDQRLLEDDGVRTVHDGELLHARLSGAREVPGDAAAPVVGDDHGLVGPKMIEEPYDVVSKRVDVVGPLGLGVVVAAQVGGDDAVPGQGERRDLVAPRPPHLGESVEQDDERALALLDVVHVDAVDGGVRVRHAEIVGGHGVTLWAGSSKGWAGSSRGAARRRGSSGGVAEPTVGGLARAAGRLLVFRGWHVGPGRGAGAARAHGGC